MKKLLGGIGIAAAIALTGGLLSPYGVNHYIDGTPVANMAEVSVYTDEMKAEAEALAAATEAAWIAALETTTEQAIRQHFIDDPLPVPIRVGDLTLVKTGDTTFEGMIELQAQGYEEHSVLVHVTDDGRISMWRIDPGALLPLFFS